MSTMRIDAIEKYASESDVAWAIVHETQDEIYDAFAFRVDELEPTCDFEDCLTMISNVESNLLATCACHIEVCNGGFYQFFRNPTGIWAPEAAVGFRELGLDGVSKLVSDAITFFDSPYPREQDPRLNWLEALPEGPRKVVDPFYRLDEQFGALLDWEKKVFERALYRYYMRQK